jgi:hypothetical protein
MRTLSALVLVLLVAVGIWFLYERTMFRQTEWPPGPTPEALRKVMNPCGQGHDRPNPVVCVDENFTTVTPLLVHVKSNEWVNFYIAGSNGDLDVQFSAATPVHHAQHGGALNAHHFRIQAKVISQQTQPYKYRLIERDSGKEIDPDIMIEP